MEWMQRTETFWETTNGRFMVAHYPQYEKYVLTAGYADGTYLTQTFSALEDAQFTAEQWEQERKTRRSFPCLTA